MSFYRLTVCLLTTFLFITVSGTVPSFAAKSPYGEAEHVIASCREVISDPNQFAKSFCNGYIVAFFHGYLIGLLNSTYAKADNAIPPESFCLQGIANELEFAQNFIRWIDTIPAEGKGESFLKETAAAHIFSFLKHEYPCN